MELLNHVVDVALVLGEARRVLRGDGRLIVTLPSYSPLRAAYVAISDFDVGFSVREPEVRFFSRHSLSGMLEEAGFAVEQIRAIGGFRLMRRWLLGVARVA